MSIIAFGSDKHLGMVGPEGAVMINSLNLSSRVSSSSKKRELAGRSPISERRGTTSADHMMYAWSMDAVRSATAGTTLVRKSKKDECPPEAYLG